MTFKFVFVVICFIIAASSYVFCKEKKDWALLTMGLMFTVAADYFLVLHDNHLPGVAVFCFAHVCYILRALNMTESKKAGHIGLIILPFLIALIFFAFIGQALFALAGIYAGLFIINIAVNIRFCKFNRGLILLGLILFALCDVNVLLFNLPRQLGTFEIFPWAFYFIWMFYLPSQILLPVSAVAYKKRITI